MTDIFISYKKERRLHVERLASILEAYGYDVWWDAELVVGPDYRSQIEKHLDASKAVLVLWDTGSIQSKFVRSEANRADRRDKLVQAYLEDVEAPVGFGESQGGRLVDWSGDPRDHALFQIIGALAGHVNRQPNIQDTLLSTLSGLPSLPKVEAMTDIRDSEIDDDVPLEFGDEISSPRKRVDKKIKRKSFRRYWVALASLAALLLAGVFNFAGVFNMNWILALLAVISLLLFASVAVSLTVELLHTVSRTRSAGLYRSLRSLFVSTISRINGGDEGLDKPSRERSAKRFSKIMSGFDSVNRIENRKLSEIEGESLDSLSRRQFVEHLAEIEFGQNLAKKSRSDIRGILEYILHHFDRICSSESRVFRRRSKFLAFAISSFFVLVANVNAGSIFLYFATNESATQSLNSMVRSNPGLIQQMVETRMDRAAEQGGVLNSDASDVSGDSDRMAKYVANQISHQLITDISDLTMKGIPTGRSYFPYCEGMYNMGCNVPTLSWFRIDPDWMASNMWYLSENPEWIKGNPSFASMYPTWRIEASRQVDLYGQSYRDIIIENQPVRYFPVMGFRVKAIPRLFTPEGVQWFVGVFLTIAVMALGAITMYDGFKKISSYLLKDPQESEEEDIGRLTDRFLIAAGAAARMSLQDEPMKLS